MIDLGKHAGPVLAAWAISLVLLSALIVRTLLRNARARRALHSEEARLRATAPRTKGQDHG